MKFNRTKNAKRNILFGLAYKAYLIILPFFIRTALLYFLGIEYLGLSSLFTSILQVLNLAELGAGTVMVYSMYKPVAEDDFTKICALLNLYKRYYKMIGYTVGTIGVIILPLVPRLIKGSVPNDINIYLLYLIHLSSTVISYLLFAYKGAVLYAYQRNDVISKMSIIVSTFQYGVQLIVLWLLKDYYLFALIFPLAQMLTNIVIANRADKLFPELRPEGELDSSEKKKINKNIRDLFTGKLGAVVVGAVDTIVISAFLGLKSLAIYQNYFYIFSAIYGLFTTLFTSVIAGIGNSIETESVEKNYKDFNVITILSGWIINICVCGFSVVYQPFIRLWVGSQYMLNDMHVYMFCVYFFVMTQSIVWASIKDAAGIWHTDRFRPLIGASLNLLLNIVLVQFIGLYGILLSTIMSYILVSMPWLVHNLFKYIYKISASEYIMTILKQVFTCALSCVSVVFICKLIVIDGVLAVLVYGMIAILVSTFLQIILYKNDKYFKESKKLLSSLLR